MIKYIIIDDETASHDIIKDYAGSLAYLSYQRSCYNAFEAIEYVNKNAVDLIFLDINMPKLSGLDFLRTLSNPPRVIITTAYKDYALEGYELNVDDYLLKPFSFPRFVKAVNKVFETISNKPGASSNIEVDDDSKIFVKEDKKYFQIHLDEILYIEAYGNYVKINMQERTIVSHQTLTSLSHSLPENKFIRTHKSFIVSKNKIESIEGNRIKIQTQIIPIGKMYKHNVNRLLN